MMSVVGVEPVLCKMMVLGYMQFVGLGGGVGEDKPKIVTIPKTYTVLDFLGSYVGPW